MRIRKITLIIILVLVISVGVFLVSRQAQDKVISYLPSDYGIPDEIAGYQVLAVKPGGSNACEPPDRMTVILRNADATQNTDIIYEVLNEIDSDKDWHLTLISGSRTQSEVIADMRIVSERLSSIETCTPFQMQPLPTNTPQVQY